MHPNVSKTSLAITFAITMILNPYATAAIDLQTPTLVIDATNSDGAATRSIPLSSFNWNPANNELTWSQSAPYNLDSDGGDTIATIQSASLTFDECSKIYLLFEVVGGSSTTTVEFTVANLIFETIPDASAEGQARASVSVSDLDNDGAEFHGLGTPGTGAFIANYNENNRFAHLVAQVIVGAGGTGAGYQNDPAYGYRAYNADVDQISAYVGFTITPNDSATGSLSYDIKPNPQGCDTDTDSDNTPDWLDDCPNDGNKTDPGDCGCGTPDTDSDNDGIPDCNDNCPDTPNADQLDQDENGIGDACEDDQSDPDPPAEEEDDDEEEQEDVDQDPPADDDDDAAPDDQGDDDNDQIDDGPADDPDDENPNDPDSDGDTGTDPQNDDQTNENPDSDDSNNETEDAPNAIVTGAEAPHAILPCGWGAAGFLPFMLLGLRTLASRPRR